MSYTKKIDLYKQLVKDLMEASQLEPSNKQDVNELIQKLNNNGLELLQFAPDHVYKEYTKLLRNWRKGEKLADVVQFIITLRKELTPDSKLTVDDVYTLTGFH